MPSEQTEVRPEALDSLLRRALGVSGPVVAELMSDGLMRVVYRVKHSNEVFYLRLAEDDEDNLIAEATVHRELRNLGVRVPEVIIVEEFDTAIGRSAMVMREIPGTSVFHLPPEEIPEDVLRQAGRDLVILNQVRVNGFAWVARKGPDWPPNGTLDSYREFVVSYLPEDWPGPLSSLFDATVLDSIVEVIEHETARPLHMGYLVQGDFDTTHIFVHKGRYSGIIDLGEIRGAECSFDLGLFYLFRSSVPPGAFEQLTQGYAEVEAPPSKDEILRSAMLLGLRQMCRWLGRGSSLESVRPRANRIEELVRELQMISGKP